MSNKDKKPKGKKANPVLEDEESKEELPEGEDEESTTEDTDSGEDTPEESDEAELPKKVEEKSKVAPKGDNSNSRNVNEKLLGKANRMASILAKEQKVQFLIPLAQGEKPGGVEHVWQNGYHTAIPKGEMVTIPMSTAQIVARKYKIQGNLRPDLKANAQSEALS